MTKKHIFLFDILLPIAFISLTGWLLSQILALPVFRWAAAVQLWGIGNWFVSSNFGRDIWPYRWPLFCIPVLVTWLLWIRLNLQYDIINYRYRMDRPLFTLFERFFQWIEGGDKVTLLKRAYEQRLAAAHDTIRKLERQLHPEPAFSEKPDSPASISQPTLPTVFPHFNRGNLSDTYAPGPRPAFPTTPIQGAARFSDTITRLRMKAEEMKNPESVETGSETPSVVQAAEITKSAGAENPGPVPDKRWDSLKL